MCRISRLLVMSVLFAVLVLCSFIVSGEMGCWKSESICVQGLDLGTRLVDSHSEGEKFCVEYPGESRCLDEIPPGYHCCYFEVAVSSTQNYSVYMFRNRTCSYAGPANRPCEEQPCYDDEDCKTTWVDFVEYCSERQGTCQKRKCGAWNPHPCPEGSYCQLLGTSEDGYCSHIDDADGDGLPGLIRVTSRNFEAEEDKERYDCDDSSAVCKISQADPGCKNSDYVSMMTTRGSKDSDIEDCWDFCMDKDGDYYCDESSSLRVEWPTLISGDDYKEKMLGWNSQLIAAEILSEVVVGEDKPISDLAKAMPFDCDDDNASISPRVKEEFLENPCDLVNNDCDAVIDECSNVTDTEGIETDIAQSCVYRSPFVGCHVLDADGDTFKNADFGCPDCTDCNDADIGIYPGATDNLENGIDENCNGVDGEMLNSDADAVPDKFDLCIGEDLLVGPITPFGCWYSVGIHDESYLPGWSVG